MSLQILRPVTIKARVTDGLKARLTAELNAAIQQLDAEMNELESQVKRAQLTASISPQQQMQLRQLVEQERAVRAEKKAQLQQEISHIQSLPLGSEVVQGTVQAIATVGVGDNLEAVMATEIVVEDGKVIAIRGEA
ncbi:Skp family chaperone for outer membrane proteins [Symbiobacterium terraclitae]|uniref:Skp family chaperone for outer membrane proteins n=1 Tax=Symbiobacterium terraclitae TaxID=557451 RepID=A0ABS4JQC3_9FIRM|nr:YlqD family protein [Symbiobacterium terraclitae]MBP2017722.1 Skp family chaperone for outer membrane proteins [Symbiobacterium terraclitae]